MLLGVGHAVGSLWDFSECCEHLLFSFFNRKLLLFFWKKNFDLKKINRISGSKSDFLELPDFDSKGKIAT